MVQASRSEFKGSRNSRGRVETQKNRTYFRGFVSTKKVSARFALPAPPGYSVKETRDDSTGNFIYTLRKAPDGLRALRDRVFALERERMGARRRKVRPKADK